MADYSTCRRCHTLMVVLDGNTVHPLCTPMPTKAERLEDRLAEAMAAQNEELEREICAELAGLDGRPPRLLDAALAYARWGWPIFPLHPGSKVPATPHGFKDAHADLERIRAYWTRHPMANIGLPTGLAFDVIDIDAPKGDRPGGWLSYGELEGMGMLTDTHGMAATANAGMHLLVEPSGTGCDVGVLAGIDYRGAGGYIVAAPSVLAGGGRWRWINVPSPVVTEAGVSVRRA